MQFVVMVQVLEQLFDACASETAFQSLQLLIVHNLINQFLHPHLHLRILHLL